MPYIWRPLNLGRRHLISLLYKKKWLPSSNHFLHSRFRSEGLVSYSLS